MDKVKCICGKSYRNRDLSKVNHIYSKYHIQYVKFENWYNENNIGDKSIIENNWNAFVESKVGTYALFIKKMKDKGFETQYNSMINKNKVSIVKVISFNNGKVKTHKGTKSIENSDN